MKTQGEDRILLDGENIVIDAATEMPDWEVRRFRRIRIHLEGVAYQLTGKTAGQEGRVRYVLEPWPEDYPDPPGLEFHYDPSYVASREKERRAAERRSLLLPLLVPFVPLIGFLPGSWKLWIHDRYGIHPRTAVMGSLAIEAAGLLLTGLFLTLNMWAGAYSQTGVFGLLPLLNDMRYLAGVALILTADLLVRYGSLLEESMDLPGFYEWLFRLRLK